MKSLRILDIDECPITDAQLARIAKLPRLETLDLWNTRVTGDGLASLSAARVLVELRVRIDERNIQQAVNQVGKLTGLKHLGIQGSAPFHDLSPLGNLTKLESLDCWVSPVNNRDTLAIAKLRLLNTLMLRQTMITDSGLEQLSQLDKLTFLRVDGFFSDKGLASLGRLKSLRTLQLASPYVSQAAVDALTAELPALHHVKLSDNDPLRPDERVPKDTPPPPPAAGAANGASTTPADTPIDRPDEQNVVEIRVVGNEPDRRPRY